MTDRLDRFLSALLSDLGEPRTGREAAQAALLSRSHAVRSFRARYGESPAEFRKRLRLERAAYALRVTARPVTEVALDAGFRSAEGFAWAFRRGFGVPPSLYRRRGSQSHLLPAPSGIHFQPVGPPANPGGGADLLTHLLAFDEQFMRHALLQLRDVPDRMLDEPLGESQPLDFNPPDRTVRHLLDSLVFTKEVWVAAVRGLPAPPDDRPRTLDGLTWRHDVVAREFRQLVEEVHLGGRWHDTFEDRLCEPPELFPLGGMVAHVLTVDAHHRYVLSAWLRRLGIRLDADPMFFGAVFREVTP